MARGRKTGGRQRGVPNRSTAELRALIDEHACPEALIKALADMALKAESEHTRLQAITALLDRRFGKPAQEVHHGGADGGLPVQIMRVITNVPLSDEEWERVHGLPG